MDELLIFTKRLPAHEDIAQETGSPRLRLALTAEERTRSRHRFEAETGEPVYLQLPRGTVLRGGDILTAAQHDRQLQIVARPEPVMTVTAQQPFDLMRAAYHLGNRHVPLELKPGYLRLSPDPVLAHMLEHLGVDILTEIACFEPESGAYGHGHQHHSHQHHSH